MAYNLSQALSIRQLPRIYFKPAYSLQLIAYSQKIKVLDEHNVDPFKLDRNAMRIVSFEEKGNNVEYWLSRPVSERLAASWKLTCAAYGIPCTNEKIMDKTHFNMRKNPE